MSPALERSRSGRGGHAWLFFEQAVPAALARRLGSLLLTEAMEDRLTSAWTRTTGSSESIQKLREIVRANLPEFRSMVK